MLVLQRGRCKLFEMYVARYVGGQGHRWKADSTARFDLGSTRLRHEGWTSADASGLSMFGGLVRFDECEREMVEHALRLVVRTTRHEYIYPATHRAGATPATIKPGT